MKVSQIYKMIECLEGQDPVQLETVAKYLMEKTPTEQESREMQEGRLEAVHAVGRMAMIGMEILRTERRI